MNKEIESIVDFISEIDKLDMDSNFFYFYRGHSKKKFKLIPSIYRNYKYIRNEDTILKEAISQAPNEFLHEKTTLEKLVKIQHYGIPTRLLDITSNPLVALYFACNEFSESNGEVVGLKIKKEEVKFYDSDTVSILANLSKRPYNFSIEKLPQADIDDFNNQPMISYLLHEIREEKPHFLPIINPRDLERVIPVKVKMNNNRIIRQNGAFLIFGIDNFKIQPPRIPERWLLSKNPNKKTTLEISANKKRKILQELNSLGINQSTLFPELQNLAEYIKKSYS